jgi:hypothetical protein
LSSLLSSYCLRRFIVVFAYRHIFTHLSCSIVIVSTESPTFIQSRSPLESSPHIVALPSGVTYSLANPCDNGMRHLLYLLCIHLSSTTLLLLVGCFWDPFRLSVSCSDTRSSFFWCSPVSLHITDSGQRHIVKVLVDCRATSLFIDARWVQANGIPMHPLSTQILVYNVDGTLNEAGAICEVVTVILQYSENKERATFAVTKLGSQDMLLRLTWLAAQPGDQLAF